MKENFGNKINTAGFDKNKHNINRKGQPKKSYTSHIKEIKDKGYSAPTKTEYYDMVGLLLSMDEEDCKEFAQDKERPYWIRLIVLDLNNKNTRQKMMGDYRDWLFGKADSKLTLEGGDKPIQISFED